MTSTTNITSNEYQVLHAIYFNEYNDGSETDYPVWTSVVADYSFGGKKFSGVVSSLVDKGLVGSMEEGKDSTIWATKKSFELLKQREDFCNDYKKYMGIELNNDKTVKQMKNLKKDDVVVIEFPPSIKEECTFIRFNKEETKVQVRTSTGRLMWYKTENIVESAGIRDREEPAKKAEPKAKPVKEAKPAKKEEPKEEKLDLDAESKKAQEDLERIKNLKKSDKHVSKKATKKEQIISLIKAGKSNKEIVTEIGCDAAYPSDIRKALFAAGQISEEIRNLRHTNKK